MNFDQTEEWHSRKKILVMLAHPDDPEFFCGGMIARWCALGHEVIYCILTRGQRGWRDGSHSPGEIANIRTLEQEQAARVLGVSRIIFLDHMDGDLIADLSLREEMIKQIREIKPQVVVTSDPQNLFPAPNRINHPDHRAAGLAVVDAVFPAAGNPCYLFRSETGELHEPHQVEELWLTLTTRGNLEFDLTQYFEIKKAAICCHKSQIRETPDEFETRMNSRLEDKTGFDKKVYIERFFRVRF